ncbi:MAG: rhodanese-like domain-containing protein [Lentisphaerae bacterium]|jgi:rhodanese-related sulfurtransferase|nr:rhodanese-like domain-containing protein [Lentisphaerota bacterium]
MTLSRFRLSARDFAQLAGDCILLLLGASLLGLAVNTLRPEATRLPWKSAWDRHIETLAFRANIPVTFLQGVRDAVADPATIVLDARALDEYLEAHLPGARPLPLLEVEQRLIEYVQLLTFETPILVYCGGADCDDALELAKRLRDYGFLHLTLYPGGLAEWVEYDGPTQSGDEP